MNYKIINYDICQYYFKYFKISFIKNYEIKLVVLDDNVSAQILDDEVFDYESYEIFPDEYRNFDLKPYDVFYLSDNYTIDGNGWYTGKLIKKFPNSSKTKCVLNFKQGFVSGVSKIYSENCLYQRLRPYRFSNQLEYKIKKMNEKKIMTNFFKNGVLFIKKIENRSGRYFQKIYNKNGHLIHLEKNYKKDLITKEWYDNGQLARLLYNNRSKSNEKYHRLIHGIFKQWNEDGNLKFYNYMTLKYVDDWDCHSIGIQKRIENNTFRSCYIIKNHKNVFNLISGDGRFNFTSPYLKSTWRIKPKIIIK
jgi:antitoxin component YwqK of YwqJK toxin-antitoxin module